MTNDSNPVLCFDTATPTARVALLLPDGTCLFSRAKTAARHSANLLSLIEEVLREGKLAVADLRAIACGAGPGSFTGLRVGLAVAKGLALPSARPLLLVSSLDALACDLADAAARTRTDHESPFAETTPRWLLPCIDAGKGQVYARLFAVANGTAPIARGDADWVLAPEQLCEMLREVSGSESILTGGTGVDRYLAVFRSQLGESVVLSALPGPSAEAIGRLALARVRRGDHDDLESAVPRYGRPPDITRPKKALLVT